ncbi:unnamed protein product [Orchesella dallaii]|uniref:Uncharacterized protein n=1 Tax=Orchesella dallaii TaxID=48710 RepID=A0ABP1RK24_9HEXA
MPLICRVMAIALTFLYYGFCILNPLIYICLNEDMSLRMALGVNSTKSTCSRSLCMKTRLPQINEGNEEGNGQEENDFEMSDFSKFPTFGGSELTAKPGASKCVVVETVSESENLGTFV